MQFTARSCPVRSEGLKAKTTHSFHTLTYRTEVSSALQNPNHGLLALQAMLAVTVMGGHAVSMSRWDSLDVNFRLSKKFFSYTRGK